MAAWKRQGSLQHYYHRIVDGMTSRGYDKAFAVAIFEQIKGFSEYGFPESHAASFALLVYASCWIKCTEPAAFLASLLNSQPLGFYSPSQLVQDAKRHGVDVRAVDVVSSEVDATLEDMPGQPAVRLGLRLVSGLGLVAARRIVAARTESPFKNTADVAKRAGLNLREMKLLAASDALASLSGHRRQQVWDASALHTLPALLRDAPVNEESLALDEAPEAEAIGWDYAATGLSLRRHPMALLRPRLSKRGFLSSRELLCQPDGRMLRVCGIVTLRQQPQTANGTIFVSLEDEDGSIQVIAWKQLRERQRDVLLASRLLGVYGQWQYQGSVGNLVAHRLVDLSKWLGSLATSSRDFK